MGLSGYSCILLFFVSVYVITKKIPMRHLLYHEDIINYYSVSSMAVLKEREKGQRISFLYSSNSTGLNSDLLINLLDVLLDAGSIK